MSTLLSVAGLIMALAGVYRFYLHRSDRPSSNQIMGTNTGKPEMVVGVGLWIAGIIVGSIFG